MKSTRFSALARRGATEWRKPASKHDTTYLPRRSRDLVPTRVTLFTRAGRISHVLIERTEASGLVDLYSHVGTTLLVLAARGSSPSVGKAGATPQSEEVGRTQESLYRSRCLFHPVFEYQCQLTACPRTCARRHTAHVGPSQFGSTSWIPCGFCVRVQIKSTPIPLCCQAGCGKALVPFVLILCRTATVRTVSRSPQPHVPDRFHAWAHNGKFPRNQAKECGVPVPALAPACQALLRKAPWSLEQIGAEKGGWGDSSFANRRL